ncbi:MAG: hypothetical protein HYZ08_01110 [Candidatus Kerfeldbacteria bacterium]|nr:hypothetical protein [Candidatus Kerfeldbacteria bacterium]
MKYQLKAKNLIALLLIPTVVSGMMFVMLAVRAATLNPLEDWEFIQPHNEDLVRFIEGESVAKSGEKIVFEIQAHCSVIQMNHLGKSAVDQEYVEGSDRATCVEGPSGEGKCVYETGKIWDTDEVLYSQVWADECWDTDGRYRGKVVTPMKIVRQ